ncbi:MAG: hypothetical protein ABSF77_19705 [Spirochaetia bacterium]
MSETAIETRAGSLSTRQNRGDMVRGLEVIGDMLEHRRCPLSVQGAQGLGFLITFAIGTLRDDLPDELFLDDPE